MFDSTCLDQYRNSVSGQVVSNGRVLFASAQICSTSTDSEAIAEELTPLLIQSPYNRNLSPLNEMRAIAELRSIYRPGPDYLEADAALPHGKKIKPDWQSRSVALDNVLQASLAL
jgi:hypothetical protein